MYSNNKILNHKLVTLTVIMGMFLWSFSAGIVNISLPTIAQFLDINISTVSWIIIIHLMSLIGLILFFGRLADYLGHKTIFVWGILIFTIFSYLCGLTQDINTLLMYRLLQGVGSAMLLSVSPAIISMTSSPKKQGRAFGYLSLATTLGLSGGYLVGGLITENLSWNWIFFANVPIGIIVLIMARSYLNNLPHESHKKGFDIVGVVISFLFYLSLIITLETIGNSGIPLTYTGFGIILSLVIILIFIKWESYHPNPLIDLKLFSNPHLSLAVATGLLTTLILTGTIFLIPFYLELVKSYSSYFSGLIVFSSSLLVLFISPIAGWLSDKVGAKIVNAFGALLLVGSMALLTLMNNTTGLVFILIALAVRALSDGVSNPANSKMVISHSSPDKLNTISSLLNNARYFGLVLGVVVFQSIFKITISSNAVSIEAPAQGALEMTLPVGTLLHGFQAAFIFGIVLSIIVIIFTIISRENISYE